MCGLHPLLRKDVLLHDPHTSEEAMTAPKRIGAIYNYVADKHSFMSRQIQGTQHGDAHGSGTDSLGYAHMDLDILKSSDNSIAYFCS